MRRIAHQLLGQLRGPFVVRDAAQHMPAQEEQVGQKDLLWHDVSCSSWSPMGRHRQAVDLGLQVGQGDGAAGGGRVAVWLGQAGDDAASSGGADEAARMAIRSGGFGLGGTR
ncbi:hypothetical protein GCM10009609_64690 [Pseudonocardia aurantiaca]